MARRSKAEAAMERKVNELCQTACFGWQINIMDLSKLSNAGMTAAKAGGDDAMITAAIEKVRAEVGIKV